MKVWICLEYARVNNTTEVTRCWAQRNIQPVCYVSFIPLLF